MCPEEGADMFIDAYVFEVEFSGSAFLIDDGVEEVELDGS